MSEHIWPAGRHGVGSMPTGVRAAQIRWPLHLDPEKEDVDCHCGFKTKASSLNGIVSSSVEIVYNPIEKRKKQKQSEDNFGPTVQRTCSACGHNEMTYKTQQMRSADEGMTIFYYCVKCGNMEKEDS